MTGVSTNPLKTLVIDDGSMNRRLCERMLQHLDCQVETAEDAELGLQAIGADLVDIVFTDVEMPGLNGTEAVQMYREEAVRAHPGRRREIFIVAVSGQALGSERQDYIDAGFDDYVAKPITMDRLSECIADWKQSRTAD
jgi:CheY-like chemotaxis protein